MEQRNLCSHGDYVQQKQMIKAGRERLASVSVLRWMFLRRGAVQCGESVRFGSVCHVKRIILS